MIGHETKEVLTGVSEVDSSCSLGGVFEKHPKGGLTSTCLSKGPIQDPKPMDSPGTTE